MTPRILAAVDRIVDLTNALDATITAALNDDPTPAVRPTLTVVDGGGEG